MPAVRSASHPLPQRTSIEYVHRKTHPRHSLPARDVAWPITRQDTSPAHPPAIPNCRLLVWACPKKACLEDPLHVAGGDPLPCVHCDNWNEVIDGFFGLGCGSDLVQVTLLQCLRYSNLSKCKRLTSSEAPER